MNKCIAYIITLLISLPAYAQTGKQTLHSPNGLWMPKTYVDAMKIHPPTDSFWSSFNFQQQLSPVTAVRIHSNGKTNNHTIQLLTYGADYFPVRITRTSTKAGQKEWQLASPVFINDLQQNYQQTAFSLVNHHNDPNDLWLSITQQDGSRDSIQLQLAPPPGDNTPLWVHANNYLTFRLRNKQFDIYDTAGNLLFQQVRTNTNGHLKGLPGYDTWSLHGNGNNKKPTVTFSGTQQGNSIQHSFTAELIPNGIKLLPDKDNGQLNKTLVLKERL